MSRIYKMIEEQVNNLLRFQLEDDLTGRIQYNQWISGPKVIKPIIQLLTTLLFLAVVLFFGVYLWNNGLQPVFPNVIAKLNPADPNQASSPYTQLLLTLMALMMII